MHSYTLTHVIARLRLPIVVQLLIIANDIAYKHKNAAVYHSINAALDTAIQHYKLA